MVSGWSNQRICAAFGSGNYRLTLHAEVEREADAITVQEIETAFGSESLEVIEEYPADPRGPSGLFLGFDRLGDPLHAVLGLADPDIVVVITIYRPDPKLWRKWGTRL